MTTRNFLLAGTIMAGPLLSLVIPHGAARAESDQMLRMAQAEPAPGERERRERAALEGELGRAVVRDDGVGVLEEGDEDEPVVDPVYTT